MSRRIVTLLVAGAGVLVALLVAAFSPVPYVALTPGPTLNTLGSLDGKPLISITGHPTHPTSGHLNMVTISYIGGPGSDFNIFAALQSWLSPDDAVVPQSELFAPGQTQQQVATAAALCQLGIPFRTLDTITATLRGLPAAGVLRKGDVITAVDGTAVTCHASAGDLIRAHKPGTPVRLTIRRGNTTRDVTITTADEQGHAVVGVIVAESYVFPFSVK